MRDPANTPLLSNVVQHASCINIEACLGSKNRSTRSRSPMPVSPMKRPSWSEYSMLVDAPIIYWGRCTMIQRLLGQGASPSLEIVCQVGG